MNYLSIDSEDRARHLLGNKFSVTEEGCWEWLGKWQTQEGFKRVRFAKKDYMAHRLAYELLVGYVPEGICVLQKCRNRACMRPSHLALGDRVFDGRLSGAGNGFAKLTEDDVRFIRSSSLPDDFLAVMFGVAHKTVASVRKKVSWRHLP